MCIIRFGVARQIGYPAGEGLALVNLGIAASLGGDWAGAVRLVRQAGQIAADLPGWLLRVRGWILGEALIEAGDLAAARDVCTAGLALCRDVQDLLSQAIFLRLLAVLDLRGGQLEHARTVSAKRCTSTSRPPSRSTCLTAWIAAASCAPQPAGPP